MGSKLRAQPSYHPGLSAHIVGWYSFLASAIITGILSFFVDALRREAMSVPWPILLVMSASCLNIISVFVSSVIRVCLPRSPILALTFHIPVAILWVVTVALLGEELGDHLSNSCPSQDTFGHDLALVCNLFKALFGFSVTCAASSVLVVVLDIVAWKRIKNMGKYTTVGAHTIGMYPPTKSSRKKKLGMLAGMLRSRKGNMQEDERSVMMTSMEALDKDDTLKPQQELHMTAGEPMRSPAQSPDFGPRERFRVEGVGHQFSGQDTRYDPGKPM
ncbi:uncharacterized protein BDR25DRAFT_342086 [Lindgomyces ingoldianus]|uniref:Uncharacterized protein n=1 Tax=Lindgomyces ingoldianus TaxID=673940 RepID=A0ACB6QZQ7_9PLEO|nr:uncharacterized protein BDR25DRAFT_342086 [Lindgomyces ingoldianus]KAF2472058.1 hypothetical protein BDR25DRAFT_342086 [Lindgomyces ingoldianus]